MIDERRWTHAGGLRLAAELDGCWMDLYYAEGAEVLTATVSVAPITVTGELAEELTAASIEKPWTVADR